MEYYEFKLSGIPDEMNEILMAELSELGFESFQEESNFINGYVPVSVYQVERILPYLEMRAQTTGLTYEIIKIKSENWNAIWESKYKPVLVDGKCFVRAPFHDQLPGVAYDIVIEPKMSFGTAHHETTALMIGMLIKEQVKGKRVLDVGCGTGVLAILAFKMDAESVEAIDPDEWAFQNAKDNILKNNAPSISVIQGDVKNVPSREYDLILANINRNVLLDDMPVYAQHLSSSGTLLVSGFYVDDMLLISSRAEETNLNFIFSKSRNSWVAAKFDK